MNSRRLLTFLVLALALLAPATAQADKAKPKSSVPKLLLTLTDGATNSKTVKPTIKLTFDPPKGTTAATACKGKVNISVPIGKKTVKNKKVTVFAAKSSAIKNLAGVCTAAPTLTLPAALLGKTLKFKAGFKGNDAVKQFAKTFSLKLAVVAAPAPTAPTPPAPGIHRKGTWRAYYAGSTSPPYWEFTIKDDNSVDSIAQASQLAYSCGQNYLPNFVQINYLTPFTVVGDSATVTDHWVGNSGQALQTTFVFRFGATTGTASVTGVGSLKAQLVGGVVPELVSGCATNGTVPLDLTYVGSA